MRVTSQDDTATAAWQLVHENERLRDEIARLRLTHAEREAIEAAARIIDAYEDEMDGFPSGAAATLRSLLERLG